MKYQKILALSVVVSLMIGSMALVTSMAVEDEIRQGLFDGYVEIYDWQDLYDIRDDLSGEYVLMNDLDENTDGYDELVDTEEGWEPIGDADDRFLGTLDGGDHTITGLYINRPNLSDVGLFGFLGEFQAGAEVINLGLEDANITGGSATGIIAGQSDRGTVENCYAKGIIDGNDHVGGLVGINLYGTVSNSHATVNVTGAVNTGGIVGWNRGTVEYTYATGDVTGNQQVGGLVGRNENTVSNSYAMTNVTGGWRFGGLVGSNEDTVSNSFAIGDVIGTGENVGGGLVDNNDGTVIASFYHEDMPKCGAEEPNSLPLDDLEFGSISTFGSAGWDIEMVETDRDQPYLSWEDGQEEPTWLIQESDTQYELTIEVTGDGHTVPEVGTHLYYEHGKIVVEAFQDQGYVFVDWTGDIEADEEVTNVTLDGDKTITANFEPISYEISDWEQLHQIRYDLTGDYTLMNDLDEHTEHYDEYASEDADDGSGWLPIGDDENQFTGEFEGNGFTIADFHMDRDNADMLGLFGFVGDDGMINDLHLENFEIMNGGNDIGGLVGRSHGMISNSSADGVVDARRNSGGLVGINHGTINNSSANSDVDGDDDVGGLVGNNHGTISNSSADSDVSGRRRLGVLVGTNDGLITSSNVSSGSVTSNFERLGGLIGYNIGTIENSHYNIETVTINGDNYVTFGGLYDEQYEDWIQNDRYLNIEDYDATLIPDGEYYEIIEVQGIKDLLGFAAYDEYRFRLASDIDLSADDGLHIPYIEADFDGDNYTISDLNVDMPFAWDVGMFGYITEGSTISNVIISGSSVTGDYYVGILSGRNRGTISNSHITGDIDGEWYVGGSVGQNLGTISSSSSAGSATGSRRHIGGFTGENRGTLSETYTTTEVTVDGVWDYIGGLTGSNSGTIENSHAEGNVSAENNDAVGGLIGQQGSIGTVSNSYATGDVSSGGNNVGGLVGTNSGTVSNSYAAGTVSGNEGVGGLVGYNTGPVINSYSEGQVTGGSNLGGLVGQIHSSSGTVSRSYSTGDVTGTGNNAGGLVGYIYIGEWVPFDLRNEGMVGNSYSTGNATGDWNVGGLIGHIDTGSVFNSYSIGTADGDNRVGGLVGYSRHEGTVENSFWDMNTSDMEESDGGVGKTTEEMMDISTFSDVDWDINAVEHPEFRNPDYIWNIVDTETYPFFSWEDSELMEIWTWEDLHNIRYNMTGIYSLMTDLTPEVEGYDEYASENADDGAGWLPVGGWEDNFSGTFDGQGNTISGLHIDRTDTDYVGLFGYLDEGEVRNVGLTEANVSGRGRVGPLVGWSGDDGIVSNSFAAGNVSGDSAVGGLVGWNDGTLSGSYATSDVSGTSVGVGGLVGDNRRGTVSNSYAAGNVFGNVRGVGGLVGYNDATVSNSHATGDVTGNTDRVGGLVGWNWGGTVSNSHATGDVSGTDEIGGLVAYNLGEITNSYSTGTTTGESMVGGLVGYNDGDIIYSYSAGTTTGGSMTGGLVGFNEYGTIEDSYSRGDVIRRAGYEDTDIGGFVGFNDDGRIINCYSTGFVGVEDGDELTENGFAGAIEDDWDFEMTGNFWDVETSGQTDTACNATGLTTSEMMTESTFTDADWDFEDIWWMVEDEYYPLLSWQGPVYNVDSRGTFHRISDAVQAPSTEDGDTVLVSSGTYKENVILSKQIRLIGSGMDESIIDAQGDGFGILVMANNTLVRGFTMMNATNDDPGAGIILLNPIWEGNYDEEGPPNTHPIVGVTIEYVRSMNNNRSLIMLDAHDSIITNSEFFNSTYENIVMMNSDDNTIADNTCRYGDMGIALMDSHNNEVYGNDASQNEFGIILIQSGGNSIHNNTAYENIPTDDFSGMGIALVEGSQYNTIADNTISDNVFGISMMNSTHNTFTGNQMFNNGMVIMGGEVEYWNTHVIDETNTVNDSPVRYIKDQTGGAVEYPAGQIILANSTDVTVDGFEMTGATGGILMGFSWDNHISNNILHGNLAGMALFHSIENHIYDNEIYANQIGIVLESESHNNTIRDNTLYDLYEGIQIQSGDGNLIYHNVFIDNNVHARDSGDNSWDAGYPTGGNYWDDHTTPDEYGGEDQDEPGSDGIVDDEREIEGGDNVDNYPWTNPHFELQIVVSDPEPEDGADAVALDTTLSVYVEADGHPTEVTFYLDGDEIYSDTITEDGQVVTDALDLEYETGYEWYVIATNDGDNNYTRTPDHTFTTLSIYELTIGDIIGQGTVEVDGVDAGVGWSGEFTEGSEVTLTAIADDGWEFVEWTGDTVNIDDMNSATTTIIMEDDYTINANFELIEHELTIDSTDGGVVTDPGEGTFSYDHGTQVPLTAQADDHYRFVEWSGDTDEIADIYSANTHIVMSDDHSITAVFEVDQQFDLYIDSTEGGQVTDPGEGHFVYDYGTHVDLVAEADVGWEFVRWEGQVDEIDDVNSASTTITMNATYSITAVFEEIIEEYDLTVEIEGEGRVDRSPDDDTYVEGTWVDLTAVPDHDWEFSHWSGDVPEGQEENDHIVIYMDDDKTVTAYFIYVEMYELTVNTEGSGSVNISPDQHEYEEGTLVDLDAIPDQGWEFSHWSGDIGDEPEDSMHISITMDDDKTVTAHFITDGETYQLTVNTEGSGSVDISPDRHEYEEGTSVSLDAIPDQGWEFSHWSGDIGDESEDSMQISILMDDDKTVTAHFVEEDDDPDDPDDPEDERTFMDTLMDYWWILVVVILVVIVLLALAMRKGKTPPPVEDQFFEGDGQMMPEEMPPEEFGGMEEPLPEEEFDGQ